MLPLSKTLDPADFDQLTEELVIVDQHFTKDREQHPMRRWEYAMALHAYDRWCATSTIAGPVYDIGGSGSPFYRMLDPWQVQVIDPDELGGKDLATYIREGPQLGAAVFCLSVLEHVDDLDRFLYHLGCLVAPGGLLFLTVDYRDPDEGLDTAHFHWDRQRIFGPSSYGEIAEQLLDRDFRWFGDRDLNYHGHQLFASYSFASLSLVKRA